jgi:hypothetical protein
VPALIIAIKALVGSYQLSAYKQKINRRGYRDLLLFVPMVYLTDKYFLCALCASAVKKLLKLKTACLKLPTIF